MESRMYCFISSLAAWPDRDRYFESKGIDRIFKESYEVHIKTWSREIFADFQNKVSKAKIGSKLECTRRICWKLEWNGVSKMVNSSISSRSGTKETYYSIGKVMHTLAVWCFYSFILLWTVGKEPLRITLKKQRNVKLLNQWMNSCIIVMPVRQHWINWFHLLWNRTVLHWQWNEMIQQFHFSIDQIWLYCN